MIKKCLLFVFLFFAVVPIVNAANSTTIGTLTLLQNLETISVTCAYTNDDNANMTAVVEYKASSSGTWLTAFTPYIDRLSQVWEGESRSLTTNPNYKQVRTSIFGLTRGTAYDVRVTFTDADTVTGTNPATASTTTWSHDIPTMGGSTYYVNSSTGSDSADGSSGTPWATLTKANSTVAAGSTIVLTGTFAGITWSKSGTSGAYVKLINSGTATISSQFTLAANYVWIEGLTFSSASFRTTGAEYCLIKNNTMHNYSGSYIGNIGLVSGSTLGLIIDGNTIYNDSIPSNESGTGIYINAAVTGRFVIRNNTIHTAYDGIGGSTNFAFSAGAPEGSDIYKNTLYNCYDDGIEIEGSNINVKIFRNKSHTAATPGYGRVGIAVAPIEIGPCFILNNVIYGVNYGFKLGYGMGKGYFINNTIWNASESGAGTAGGSAANLEFYNNIFKVTGGYTFESGDSYSTGWICNYNNLDSSGISTVKWLGSSQTYIYFRSTLGQEANGKNVASGLVNPTTDLSLGASSLLINAGLNFNGIAFDYAGNVRTGTFDIGAYEYTSGSDVTAPVCIITSPTTDTTWPTSSATLTIQGSATDAVGVTSVTWACPTCTPTSDTATCTGCTGLSVTWEETNIILSSGENVITVSATDGTNTGVDVLTVTYTPISDLTPPTVTAVSVNGATATITFDETVVTTGYDTGDFNLDCTSPTLTDVALSSPSGSGASRTFTIATPIVYGQVCNLDYTGSTNDIEDTVGNDMVAFSNMDVTNSTPQSGGTPEHSTSDVRGIVLRGVKK